MGVEMFVAVAMEMSDEDHKNAANAILLEYGFRQVLENVYESRTIHPKTLIRLKRDLDRVADSYDRVKFYQYPLDGRFTISSLLEKRWRKTIIYAEAEDPSP